MNCINCEEEIFAGGSFCKECSSKNKVIDPSIFLGAVKRRFGISIFLVSFIAMMFLSNYKTSYLPSDSNASTNIQLNKEEYVINSQSYDYKDISRYPNDYKGKSAVFRGQVIQATESGNNVMLRINVTKTEYGIWDDAVYIDYKKNDLSEQRIAENNIVRVWGELNGIKTYNTIISTEVQVPWMLCKFIEVQK
jgi:hypothetical protein